MNRFERLRRLRRIFIFILNIYRVIYKSNMSDIYIYKDRYKKI